MQAVFVRVYPDQEEKIRILREIAVYIFQVTFESVNSPEQMRLYTEKILSLENLTQEIQNPESFFFLVYHQDQPAGYLKFNIGGAQTESRPPNQMEIQRFYLHPEFHGTGMAGKMMDYSLQFARDQGKKTVWLGVAEDNIPAWKFYHKCGFIATGKHPFDFAGEIQWDVCMEKEL